MYGKKVRSTESGDLKESDKELVKNLRKSADVMINSKFITSTEKKEKEMKTECGQIAVEVAVSAERGFPRVAGADVSAAGNRRVFAAAPQSPTNVEVVEAEVDDEGEDDDDVIAMKQMNRSPRRNREMRQKLG